MRALISVSNKRDIVTFAKKLMAYGWDILSTGGTATLLKEHGIAVTDVADYTGFPEIMDGRVKTLHPKIHGGILARRGQDDAVLQTHDITPIDLVVANLYPFQQVTAQADCDLTTAIENIDIGGPSMLRAAAKNYAHVTVVSDPTDYPLVLAELREKQQVSMTTRLRLAQKCFAHTAQYDSAIANYLAQSIDAQPTSDFPPMLHLCYHKQQNLRYGENPHQAAAFYTTGASQSGSLSHAQQLQGKELSFNNLVDSQAALACVKAFTEPTCVIVKHANPCGIAQHASLVTAYQNARRTDPTSSFGGIIAVNRPLTGNVASAIIQQQFVEVIIAPTVTPDAIEILAGKPNVRLLACGEWLESSAQSPPLQLRSLGDDGLLIQQADHYQIRPQDLTVVSKRQPSDQQLQDLSFAWQVAKFVKSNAIVYAKDNATLGIGAGQMSRVDSAKIAGLKAVTQHLSLQGAAMASDAFFPFRDAIDTAVGMGIGAIIQPGGSKRDAEVIQAADEAGLVMLFTGVRHFYH
jgi:phosphoribosylaminoimidazolecarboxamide formyltransferase / IMP cyclohydrolase